MRDHSPRVWVLGLVVLCFMGALLGRLGQVQIVGHEDYQRAAATLNTRTVDRSRGPGPHPRPQRRAAGRQHDRDRRHRRPRRCWSTSPDGGRDLVTRVASVLGAPFDQLWGRTQLCGVKGAPPAPVCWAGSAYVPIPLVSGADPRKALSLLERPDLYPGVGVSAQPVRDYPAERTVNAAHLLGYLGRGRRAQDVATSKGAIGDLDLVGRSGLEQQYDAQLRGTPGTTHGRRRPARHRHQHSSGRPTRCPAQDLVTNLDARVQSAAEKALAVGRSPRARTSGPPGRLGRGRGPRRHATARWSRRPATRPTTRRSGPVG